MRTRRHARFRGVGSALNEAKKSVSLSLILVFHASQEPSGFRLVIEREEDSRREIDVE